MAEANPIDKEIQTLEAQANKLRSVVACCESDLKSNSARLHFTEGQLAMARSINERLPKDPPKPAAAAPGTPAEAKPTP